MSERECRRLFKKALPLLYSSARSAEQRLFFGDEAFPMWYGYTLGYLIVRDFLRDEPHLSWEEITRLRPAELLRRTSWGASVTSRKRAGRVSKKQ